MGATGEGRRRGVPCSAHRRVASWEKREGILAENAAPKIASRDEVLEMLTEKARQGYTGAMIALERALRAAERREREGLDNELDRILTK